MWRRAKIAAPSTSPNSFSSRRIASQCLEPGFSSWAQNLCSQASLARRASRKLQRVAPELRQSVYGALRLLKLQHFVGQGPFVEIILHFFLDTFFYRPLNASELVCVSRQELHVAILLLHVSECPRQAPPELWARERERGAERVRQRLQAPSQLSDGPRAGQAVPRPPRPARFWASACSCCRVDALVAWVRPWARGRARAGAPAQAQPELPEQAPPQEARVHFPPFAFYSRKIACIFMLALSSK